MIKYIFFIFFTLSGTHTRAHRSSRVLQLPPTLLTLKVKGQQRRSSEFILSSAGLTQHG